MEQKLIDTMLVYGLEIKTSLNTIWEHVRKTPEKIAIEISKAGAKSIGDQIWEYEGADGNAETIFSLKIAFPVETELNENNGCCTMNLDPFKCISHIHKGSWNEFSSVYEKLMVNIIKEGYQITGRCREIYMQCDFDNPENCITEIQVEIL